ncbi:MAG: hypothetical protein QM572_07300 [Nocardioides sp.]|uniref:hypothetical protein n=1 Tax=Nocardioides sp. TaxID=35761 RepID=UPI0039E38CFC
MSRETSRDIERAINGRISRTAITRQERMALQDIRAVHADAAVVQAQIAAIADVTEYAFYKALDLDDARQRLAGGDPAIAALLATFEATAIAGMQNIIRRHSNNP